MGDRGRRLPRSFYRRNALDVAPDLLNKVLVGGSLRARIVEVEAYLGGGVDPGSHSHRGKTPRNATMFGPPGHLYVYFTYGMHWCANVVCGNSGDSAAVLLRAAVPLAGVEDMRTRRAAARRDVDLLRGPARLCQAFGITGADDGADLCRPASGAGLTVLDDGVPPPEHPPRSARIGLATGSGDDLPWRWFVPNEPHVSGRRRADLQSPPDPLL